jgi:uncharacterized protein with HEPN domain
MPSKQPIQRLGNIVENIQAIAEFTVGMRYEDCIHDRKTIYAVTRAHEITSATSRRLPLNRMSASGARRDSSCQPDRFAP